MADDHQFQLAIPSVQSYRLIPCFPFRLSSPQLPKGNIVDRTERRKNPENFRCPLIQLLETVDCGQASITQHPAKFRTLLFLA